jgi:hypothetical protein
VNVTASLIGLLLVTRLAEYTVQIGLGEAEAAIEHHTEFLFSFFI